MQNKDSKRDMLIHGNIVKLMFKLSIPAIVGMLVIGLYSFIDAIFVGQWVGEKAMGAISVAYPLTLINNGIAVLVGIGSASVLSRAIGKKDQGTVDKIMGNLFMMVLILSSITTVIGIFFTEWLLSFSRVEGEMLDFATKYLRVIFIGSFFVNFSQSANMIIRGEGKIMTAMIIMAIGAILNIILDPIFIKVLGYGIEGASVATIIAQITQAIFTFIYFYKFSPQVKFHKYKLDFNLIPKVTGVGVSAMLMQVMSLISQTVLYSTLNTYGGEEKVILMGATMRYMMLSFIPIWGMSQGFQPVAGTNYGAEEYDRVKKSTRVFGLGSVALGVLFWVPFLIFTDSILSFFITNPSIIVNGLTESRLCYILFPISGTLITFITLFQSVGDGGKAGIFVLLRQLILLVPLVIVLPRISNLGSLGVFLSFPITDVLVLIISSIFVVNLFRNMGNKNHHTEPNRI